LPPKEPNSLGQLAGRISAWTTRGLLSAMLLVAALGFGREVLHWWHDDNPKTSHPFEAPDPLGDPSALQILDFGDQAWSIRRQGYSGPAADLPLALQAACKAAISDAHPRLIAADAAERELLARLAGEKPVAENQGQWRLYQWTSGYPVLIGTRAVAMRDIGEAAPGTILDMTAYRVVIWGIAVPGAASNWTLYLFLAGGSENPNGSAKAVIPLPPGARRLIAMRGAEGGAITAFSTGDVDAAREFYDHWFAEQGWQAANSWQRIATGWNAHFERHGHGTDLAVDIRLGSDAQGGGSGLVMENGPERAKP
jgi:hypothetical protein